MRSLTLFLLFILLAISLAPLIKLPNEHNLPDNTVQAGQPDRIFQENGDEGINSTIVYPFDEHFLNYTTYDDLTDTLFQFQTEYPDIVRVHDLTALTSFGATHYDRAVWGVKISDGVNAEPEWYDDPDEEDVVIVGAHHAREWMSIMVPLYYIYYLTEFYGRSEIDNDEDGLIDEDPIDGWDNDGDGEDDDGDLNTTARMDGRDNDEDGLIDECIDEDGIEGLATFLVNHREIWVIPLLNPDGFEYDLTISEPGSGGGWRKNQRDQSVNGGKRSSGNGQFDPDTDGVDLNRNYPYGWNRNEKGYLLEDDGVIITSDSRQENDAQYRGPDDDIDNDGDAYIGVDPVSGNPVYDPDGIDEDWWDFQDNDGDGLIDEDKDGGFTEPETQAMEELMKKLDHFPEDMENDTTEYPEGYRPEHHDGLSNVITGISYHSYSALVIWPWGYTYQDPPHEPLLRNIGETMMDITDYASWKDQGGYKVSGEWGDWMYGSHGVLSYTIELNTGQQGGFHPMPEYIIPTVRMNLGCNLYVTEIASKAKVARDEYAGSMEIGFPELVYDQKDKKAQDGEDFKVKVQVGNCTNLEKDSLMVWYRVGEDGDWRSKKLTKNGDGVFKGSIPGQDSGERVYFYFEGRDVRGIFVYSDYGEGTLYSYKVEDKGFLALDWMDGLLVMLIVGFLWKGKEKPSLKKLN